MTDAAAGASFESPREELVMTYSRREFLLGGALAATALTSMARPAVATNRVVDGLQLTQTFSENFDGPLSLWNAKTHQGRWKTSFSYGDPFGPSGRIFEDAISVDADYCGIDPFNFRDGYLRMELARTNSSDIRLGGKKLTFGALTTERSFVQTYGYFECRLATPSIPGCWPAFWLYSAPVPDLTGTRWDNGLGYGREWTEGLNNEIDVVEILTNDTSKTYHTISARHNWKNGRPGSDVDPAYKPTVIGPYVAHSEGTSSPRAYGVLWAPDRIVFYVDDVEIFRAANPGVHDPMYMIVNMAAGGWNGNVLAPDFVSAQMAVDYVRAFAIVT